MIYWFINFIFVIFDSVLAILFLLEFNGYRIKEKAQFLILFPILLIITEVTDESFSIVAIFLSVVISFIMMIITKFERTSKQRCLWSCILFYALLMLINTLVYNVFQSIINVTIDILVERFDIYIIICIIAKCLMLLTTILYIFIWNKVERYNSKVNTLNLIFISLFNILLIIIMQVSTIQLSSIFSFLIIGLFIGEIIHYYMYAQLSSNERFKISYEILKQKNDSDKQLYIERRKQYEEISKINHDMNNHLTQIAYLIRNKHYEKAEKYLQNMMDHVCIMNNDLGIFNCILDIILIHKIDKAKKNGIYVTAQIEDIKDCILDDFDLSTLLGNIFDNAIEASKRQEQKVINIQIYNLSGYQIFHIKNKIDCSVLDNNPDLLSTKRDKKTYGLGIKQIHNIAKKYRGLIDIYEKDKYFNVKVLIPRKNEDIESY